MRPHVHPEFFRRNLGPWADRMRRVSVGAAFALESLLAGQAPASAIDAEKR